MGNIGTLEALIYPRVSANERSNNWALEITSAIGRYLFRSFSFSIPLSSHIRVPVTFISSRPDTHERSIFRDMSSSGIFPVNF